MPETFGLEPSGKIVLTRTVGEIMLEKTGTDITNRWRFGIFGQDIFYIVFYSGC